MTSSEAPTPTATPIVAVSTTLPAAADEGCSCVDDVDDDTVVFVNRIVVIEVADVIGVIVGVNLGDAEPGDVVRLEGFVVTTAVVEANTDDDDDELRVDNDDDIDDAVVVGAIVVTVTSH